jgi:hypothetical protein
MKKNIIKDTILNQDMKAAATTNEAWINGDKYFHAVEAEAYKQLTTAQLSTLLHSATALQRIDGYLCLYEDPTMPGDARVDIIYKPSYAIAAVAIYALQKHPEIFDKDLHRFAHDLLEGTFRHGIIGHGIESDETVRRTLLMLCKAGLREFLKAKQDLYPTFSKAINRHLERYLELAKQIDEQQIIVTANGFSPDSINHLIKELVAYWNGYTRPVFVYGTLERSAGRAYAFRMCVRRLLPVEELCNV